MIDVWNHMKGIEAERHLGSSWAEISDWLVRTNPGEEDDLTGDKLRKRYAYRKARMAEVYVPESPPERAGEVTATALAPDSMDTFDKLLDRLDVPDEYEPELVNLRVSEWDMPNGEKGESVRVSAKFQRKSMMPDDVRDIWDAFIADISTHRFGVIPEIDFSQRGPERYVAVLSVADPHFGMLAHGDEVGDNYDLGIARNDYERVSHELLDRLDAFPLLPGRVVVVVGNDLFHANSVREKVPMTRRGTPQDYDTRFHEVFTQVRRSVTRVIDAANVYTSQVDVVVVPGNHDHDECYRLGEVLNAWYRNTPGITVQYSANKRQFYGFGKVALMLTHGEEYRRKRENLSMIMLTEMPNEMLVASQGGIREVLTGHNHASMAGGYYPTGELSESRGVRVRSLPGLTDTDAWHHERGYQHHRAGTMLIYDTEGGSLHSYHEARP